MLDKEYNYYLQNQDELAKVYQDRYIVIKGEKVIGDYESLADAYQNTKIEHELGTFLIQLCESTKSTHKQTFHSRVVFA